MELITREDAREQGLKTYFTGEVCAHGHISGRRTDSNQCCECQRITAAKYAKEHAGENVYRSREWYAANKHTKEYKEKAAAYAKKHYQKNREKIKARERLKRKQNGEVK
jgi:hypothetical protein